MSECNCDEWVHVMKYKPFIEEMNTPVFDWDSIHSDHNMVDSVDGTPITEFDTLSNMVNKLNSGEIEPIGEETHLDCRYRAVLVCDNCQAEQEIVRQGEHFEDDLNLLLEIVGEMMYKLDPNGERMLEEE